MANPGPQGFLPAAVVYGAFLECTQAGSGFDVVSNVCNIARSWGSLPDLGSVEKLTEHRIATARELAAVGDSAGNS